MLRYLSGIVTSTFKAGTGGPFASPSFSDLSGVFPTIFLLYLRFYIDDSNNVTEQFWLYSDRL